ncbi:MAG TPA: ADP-ribosylglycohydrolase family protein [Streptosporangiaceae bacterium]|nr:ADP-ribosylglycohydrolase family protein [Streptosporangiaceae bacterium]
MDEVGSGARSRALGALYGLAIGDALGMPTQSRSRADIVARYGSLLDGFEPGPPGHPLAAGLPAGTVTDDTEQAVLLARLVIKSGGTPDPAELASELVAWEASMRARGSLDLLGPSTRQALGAVAAGASIEDAGRSGTTNGAAMRVTPVGVATPSGDRGLLLDRVVAASRVTHNTGIALAGAAAVAAAVSAGIDGASVPEAVQHAAALAADAAARGHWAAGADVASRLTWAAGLVAGLGREQAMDVVYRLVGTSLATQESVPAAFAVATVSPQDPWLACRIAASLGGDCDTVAAMTGAICGACQGVESFPEGARSTVTRVNVRDLGLEGLDVGLLAVRSGTARRAGGDAAG